MKPLKMLDLFSGIGGFALAARMVGGINTTQFCEIDPYCQKVLQKNFPGVPIHDDITTFTAEPGRYDLITGGFPCQDISSANPNGRGLEGKRSGLFYELIRIVCECRPCYIVLENVSAMLSKQNGRIMGSVLWALSESGYDAEWQVISAASVGAPHLRERVFIVAYCQGLRGNGGNNYTESFFQQVHKRAKPRNSFSKNFWSECNREKDRSPFLRVDDGVPNRVDRIRGLGNAVVPQVAAIVLQRVLNLDGKM
jgi:DNA (cytosine-5)-methyltransferase 1